MVRFPFAVVPGFQVRFRCEHIAAVKDELFKVGQLRRVGVRSDSLRQQIAVARPRLFVRFGGPLVFVVNPAFGMLVAPKLDAAFVVHLVERAVLFGGIGLVNHVVFHRGFLDVVNSTDDFGFRGFVLFKRNVLHFRVLLALSGFLW